MSDTIDLTGDDNNDGRRSEHNNQQQGGQRQRRRTTAPQHDVARPSNVYIVIHDKEPQDSGSDYHYSSTLPSRQDTKIIGVFYEYSSAALAAEDYVREEFCIDEDEEDDEDEGPFSGIDWQGEGWFRPEEWDANECDVRVHIQCHRVR